MRTVVVELELDVERAVVVRFAGIVRPGLKSAASIPAEGVVGMCLVHVVPGVVVKASFGVEVGALISREPG